MTRRWELHAHGRGLAEDDDDVAFTPERRRTIAAETLIVFGDRDPLYPVSIAYDLYAAIPCAWLWVVPNGGHGPIFGGHAKPVVETTLAFFRGEWQPVAG